MIYFQYFFLLIMVSSVYLLFQNNKVYELRIYINEQWHFYARSAIDAMKNKDYTTEVHKMLLNETNRFYKLHEKFPSYHVLLNPFKYHPKKMERLKKEFDESLELEYQKFLKLL